MDLGSLKMDATCRYRERATKLTCKIQVTKFKKPLIFLTFIKFFQKLRKAIGF